MDDFILYWKNKLIMHLESVFSCINTLNDLSTLSDEIEEEIEKVCNWIVLGEAKKLFMNFSRDTKFYNYLVDDSGRQYIVRFATDLTDFREVYILLCDKNVMSYKDSFEQNILITGYGRCKKIVLKISNNLKLRGDLLFRIVKTLYETAYGWFKMRIDRFVSLRTVSVAHKVYEYFRQVLCNDNLYNEFWLAVVGKGFGFRLVNEEQVRALFVTFSKEENFPLYSVNDYVGNLISTRLPYDELLMKSALDYNQKINGDISRAKYTKEGNIYSKTMYALYGGDAFSIYPLVRGDIGMVALFPVEYKEAIESHLDYMKEDIVKVIQRELSNIEMAYLMFDDNYKEDIETDKSYLANINNEDVIMGEMDEILKILNMYYGVYCKFESEFIFDSCMMYSEKEVHRRKLLVRNGMLKSVDGGYCITNKGIRYKEGNCMKKGLNIIENNNLSGNNGVIIIASETQGLNNSCCNGISAKEYSQVAETIGAIKQKIVGSEEEDYVNTLLTMLEKEINRREPKTNMIKTVLGNLAAISTISSLVIKLGEMLPFLK